MKPRLFLLVLAIAASAAMIAAAGAASAASSDRPGGAPVRHGLPTIAGTPNAGSALRASPGRWVGMRRLSYRWERCNASATRCRVVTGPTRRHPQGARTYMLSAADVGHRIRVNVRASNRWGSTSATSRATALVKTASTTLSGLPGFGPGSGSNPIPSPSPNPGPGGGGTTPDFFSTVASSENGLPPAGIPRADSTCAAAVTPTPENRPQNTTANHSVPSDPSSIDWGPALNYWTDFVADRDHVTGDFTGTTDEILQWAACKWGFDVDLVRAETVVESYWVQSTVGDNCGVAGEASYGLLQVKNKDCSGNWVHGGWPYTQDDSALDVDYWGARMRACFDGAFYDGGQWLYGGQTIAQVIAQHGQDYALWGCVGSWFSGNWYDSGAQNYIATVQGDYNSKPWLQPGF